MFVCSRIGSAWENTETLLQTVTSQKFSEADSEPPFLWLSVVWLQLGTAKRGDSHQKNLRRLLSEHGRGSSKSQLGFRCVCWVGAVDPQDHRLKPYFTYVVKGLVSKYGCVSVIWGYKLSFGEQKKWKRYFRFEWGAMLNVPFWLVLFLQCKIWASRGKNEERPFSLLPTKASRFLFFFLDILSGLHSRYISK